MKSAIRRFLELTVQHHFWGSIVIVAAVAILLSLQIGDRRSFANSELYQDVVERWGAPIEQPAPSVRYVASGTVFNDLSPLALSQQHIKVDASMNYRKRGLVYFSGFDFSFSGDYLARNEQEHDIDAAFIFPVSLEKNKVLLSDLVFTANGEPASVALRDGDKLVWTGRIGHGEQVAFHVAFRGRGLDSFRYVLDPGAPVRDFSLALAIHGGDHYDYPGGVVPALNSSSAGDLVSLNWNYAALESGVPVGVILPAEKAYDQLISTITRRAWAPFLLLFLGLVALCLKAGLRPRFYQSYLMAAGYALYFLLMAYLAAFMSFWLAWPLSFITMAVVLTAYFRSYAGAWSTPYFAGLLVSFMLVPSLAVILEGYTGLIYTLELLALVVALMVLTSRAAVRDFIDGALAPSLEPNHVA